MISIKTTKNIIWTVSLFREWIHRDIFLEIFSKMPEQIDFVFHLGARTDTTSKDKKVFDALNVKYSQDIWKICTEYQIPLVYASSAATYGRWFKRLR